MRMKMIDFINDVIYILFVMVGGKFYLDWLLITNPKSKNPPIKWLWFAIFGDSLYTPRSRYIGAYLYGGIHLIFCICMIVCGGFWTVANFLVNVYPILVQIYIGFRCYRIIQYKKLRSK